MVNEKRSEMDKIIQSPVEVTLGGGKYTVSPLPIKYSIPWVKKLLRLFASTVDLATLDVKDNAAVGEAIVKAMAEKPEELTNLFWEYSKLDRSKLEEVASSSEVMAGFGEVLEFELPFLLGMNVLTKISPKAPPSS